MKAIIPFTSLLYLLIGHAECSRRLGGMDDPSDNYLTAITYRYGVQVPVLSTCGGLMGSSSSRITEECNKSMTLDGYLPAKDVCPHTCSGSSGGGGVVVDHNGDNGDPEECLEETICEKGSTEMKFKVIDATCAESDNTQGDKFYYSTDAGLSFPLYINLSAKGDVYYQGMVDRGEIITLGNGGNKFAADTDVVVKSSPTGTTYQSFSFHTSCSRNLFIGDSFCAIQLLEFTNSEQGTVSCVPPCVDEMGEFLWKMSADGDPVFRTCEWLSNRIECEINDICTSDPVPGYTHAKDLCPETCQACPVDDDCVNERCTDRPTTMTFKVTGGDCGATTHNQEGKFECTDNSDITYPATVVMKSAKRGDEYYRGTVYEGDVIVASNDGDEFDADMTVEIKSGSRVKQEMTIHSSCSKKLFVGDMFGGVKLISFTNEYQGTVEECTPPEPPIIEPCPDECAPPYNFEEPYSEDDLGRLEFCCSELVDKDERPDKDLCCSALVDDPPSYCACEAPYPDLPFTDEEQDVLEECCNSDNPPPQTVCCSLDNPPPYCACTAPYPDLPFSDAEEEVLEECCDSDDPPPKSVCCSISDPPGYCACEEPYPSYPFSDEEQDALEECCDSDNPPPKSVCCKIDEPPAYCACEAPYPDLPFTDEEQDVLEECCNTYNPPPTDVCCSLDSPPGYCVPSEVPSEPPSDPPTDEPTPAPTKAPTPAPTPAPTSCSELCDTEEQGDFRFLLSFDKINGFDIPIVKSCNWLAMKPKFRRDIICSSTDSYLGYKPARQVCTTTCNLCPCSHIPSEVPTPAPTKTPSQPPTDPPTAKATPDDPCSPPITIFPELTDTDGLETLEFCCSDTFDPDVRPDEDLCCQLEDPFVKPDYCKCEPCDPYTDPECPFECPHDVCEERPQEFYFRFSGGSCDDSNNSQDYGKFSCNDIGTIVPSRSHYLVFTSAKSDAEVYFEDWVDPGEVVTLTHTGKFQADMRVDVYAGRKIWLQQSLVYHSSCSQNLFNGDIFGAVTLMGFKSYYQNSKCTPTNCVEPDCDPDTDPDCPQPPCDREICEVRPDQFFFKLTGGSCSESVNEQPSKFYCNEMGMYDNTRGKYLEFTDTSGYEVYYKGFAAPNQVVTLVPESGRFPADMMIQVYTSANKLYKLQDIQYHSSCSKNLFNGDSFGAVTLVGFKSYYQDVKCF